MPSDPCAVPNTKSRKDVFFLDCKFYYFVHEYYCGFGKL